MWHKLCADWFQPVIVPAAVLARQKVFSACDFVQKEVKRAAGRESLLNVKQRNGDFVPLIAVDWATERENF
jgi:hypothetical protein